MATPDTNRGNVLVQIPAILTLPVLQRMRLGSIIKINVKLNQSRIKQPTVGIKQKQTLVEVMTRSYPTPAQLVSPDNLILQALKLITSLKILATINM